MRVLLVADSFLVADGKVRGLDLHRERFVTTCTTLGVPAGKFWDESVEQLPRTGRWFPRFELTVGPSADHEGSAVVMSGGVPAERARLELRLRPAPPTGGSVGLAVHDGPDPRTDPRVKGPDLAALGELKARAAAESGADEVLLVDRDGVVLEAAYSGVLWWEDDVLCVPPADRAVLPSVTVCLLRRIAGEQGVEVAERARTAGYLRDQEIWLANALHGIRPVGYWVPSPANRLPLATDRLPSSRRTHAVPGGMPEAVHRAVTPRTQRWQQHLEQLATALPSS